MRYFGGGTRSYRAKIENITVGLTQLLRDSAAFNTTDIHEEDQALLSSTPEAHDHKRQGLPITEEDANILPVQCTTKSNHQRIEVLHVKEEEI
jgi:hypothetical protein